MPRFYVNGQCVYNKECDVDSNLCPVRLYVVKNAPVHSMDKEKIEVTVFCRDVFTRAMIDECRSCLKR